jgi:tetratricopeptide (TPR) repeat protein
MKSKYAIPLALLLSLNVFAQKEELKALKKIKDKEQPTPADFVEFKKLLTEVEPKMGTATPEQVIDFTYYKGMNALIEMSMNPATAAANFPVALDNLNKVIELEKSGKKRYTKEIQEELLPEIKTGAVTMAQQLMQQKMYKQAAPYYIAAYKVDPNDASNLYNAAASAVNGQDYTHALEYYLELNKIGFTGEGTSFTAKNVKTGEVEGFPSKVMRDLAVTQKLYSDPKDEKLPSLRGDIVKNIALIYIQNGEIEKAKQAMADAKKANPDDVSLIISEADLYLKTKDMVTYKKLIGEAIQKNPTNADLFYNLGVVTSTSNIDEAMANYSKALEIKPDYVNALINLGVLHLNDEKNIVDEMNNLGNTAKDNQRYDVLKKQRDALYNKALPYFERAYKADPTNQDAISLLMNVYQALERTEDAKAMKAKMTAQ